MDIGDLPPTFGLGFGEPLPSAPQDSEKESADRLQDRSRSSPQASVPAYGDEQQPSTEGAHSRPAPQPKKKGSFLPPHHLEAERSVLGAILLRNDAINHVIELGLEARDFYKESHQKIFETLLALNERGEPVDLITLTSALKDRGAYDAVGGTPALTGLFDDSFGVGNISHYCKIVRDKALLRRIIDTAVEISEDAFTGVEDTEAFLDEAERKIFSVSDTKLNKTFSAMKDVLMDSLKIIEDAAQKKSDIIGLSTGFTDYDRLTSGLRPGQLVVLAARPAMGKTSMFLSMAQHMAFAQKSVIAIFSLEMSKEELCFRMLSGIARIDAKKLKIGRLQDRDWSKLAQASAGLSKAKINIDDSGDLTVMDIRARCRRLLMQERKLDLIVVDYLQLMKGSKKSQGDGSREREISEISRNLKALAKELKVPIIALSQLNRGVESRPNKRPMLSDLRESGAIEQDADMVCFIYRDEVYNKDSEDRGVAELIVAKHRAGETATVRLAWIPEYTLFANLAPDSPGTPIGYRGPEITL